MDFKTYLKQTEFKVCEEEENDIYSYKVPIKDYGDKSYYQIVGLSYISQADMKRIRAMYNYLFEFQEVNYDQFFDMVKEMPKFVNILKRYPENSFEETMNDLMDNGPTSFAEVINDRQGRTFDKTNKDRTL